MKVLILLSLPGFPTTSMANVLIVLALASVSAYLVRRALRASRTERGIDVGPVSTNWIAERRREEPR